MKTNVEVEHAKFEDFFSFKEGMENEALRAAINKYLEPFAKPAEDGKCLKCRTVQGGLMGGGFRYGIAHGEGRCSKCGWPGRANHYPKDENGEDFARLTIILQYHPDFVEEKS